VSFVGRNDGVTATRCKWTSAGVSGWVLDFWYKQGFFLPNPLPPSLPYFLPSCLSLSFSLPFSTYSEVLEERVGFVEVGSSVHSLAPEQGPRNIMESYSPLWVTGIHDGKSCFQKDGGTRGIISHGPLVSRILEMWGKYTCTHVSCCCQLSVTSKQP
jgi:hypothetical protein